MSADGEIPAGNEEVKELLNRCLVWSQIVLDRLASLFSLLILSQMLTADRKGKMPEAFQDKYLVLVDIRNKLEKLSLTQAWSLRETDLYDFQRQLEKIDESRVDHNFVDAEGNFAELYVQRVCLLGPILLGITDRL